MSCGTKLEQDWNLCPNCGQSLTTPEQNVQLNSSDAGYEQPTKKICLNCGREIQESWTICPYCKNRIKFTSDKKPIIPGFPNWLAWIVVIIIIVIALALIIPRYI
ncbi:MAG: double zinc ribbon domain-containing protein [Candidatus Hodarchaeales archaeon]